MPRDLDDATTHLAARFRPTADPGAPFELVVVTGPDAGARFTLDGAEAARVLIGKGPSAELRLSDPTVSRRHAALDVQGDLLRVVDLGSRNGTRVNDVIVNDANLRGGELIGVGSTSIRVERGAAGRVGRITSDTHFGHVIGASREMRRLYPLCHRLALSEIPVIIEGETGVGKELLAESIHDLGPRARAPFVVFDCTTVPPSLVEAELFGHEKGAFTGAAMARKGVFEAAHRGTLFIDEIGDLELSLQAKLLRAIERSEFRPIGATEMRRVDVRILAATRRDLDHEVQAGRFRDDLFHRLAVGRIELPPLRERRGDVLVLARHFADQLAGPGSALPTELLTRWEDDAWPGNVRQLRNAVARYLALGELDRELEAGVGPAAAPEASAESAAEGFIDEILNAGLPLSEARDQVLQHFERLYVERALSASGGNVTHAARAAGVGRRYFQYLKARRTTGKA